MSFTRRYQSFPPSQVISQIEGVVIVDAPAPSTIQGVSTGVVGVIGEFADMGYATSVDGSGNVTTKLRPVEVTSAQDLINKVGGWDATLGDFGGDDGNGYVTVYGKRFSRLILCPVNLASSKAVRLFRELPTNRSATDARPIGTMQAVSIPAGTEFLTGSNRVRLATSVTFTSTQAYAFGTDGAQVGGVAGVTQLFTSVVANFVAAGVQAGDALVLGVISGDGLPGTYRIVSVDDANTLTIEKQDGSSFSWASETDLPWRIHEAATADTGGETALAAAGGFTLPARPLDATVGATTSLAPTAGTAAGTAIAWNPRSGLTLRTGSALTYTAAIQAPNAAQSSAMDALYTAALDAFLADSAPVRDISIVVTSRTSETIRNATKTHVLSASSTGRGRMACIAPPINEFDEATVLGTDYVEATRDERIIFCWPGVKQFVEPSVGSRIKMASGLYSVEGLLDVRADIFMASVLSNLAAERNPGQATDPIPLCLSPILAFQSGNIPSFSMTDYTLFKQNGICAIRFDRTAGKIFQSGITSSLTSSQKNINRRRMADEIQDSLAAAYSSFIKQPLTSGLKSSINSETVAYLAGLKSSNNPAAQRIEDFSVDVVSGNTLELAAQGIHVVVVRVKMLATADNIVLQAEVGQSVNITTT